TGAEAYTDKCCARIDHILTSTAAARGAIDYSGRAGPCWRAGNYTAGHGELLRSDHSPGIQLRWAGSTPGDATAQVTRTGQGTFDLVLSHPASATLSLTDLSLDPTDESHDVDAGTEAHTPWGRWPPRE